MLKSRRNPRSRATGPGAWTTLLRSADMHQPTEHHPGTENSGTPNLSRLRLDQINGWYCALCDRRLYRDRSIGVHDVPFGSKTVPIELWACAPTCETTKAPTGRQA
jgi:hypothetical protein